MGFFASSGILNQRGFFSAPVSAAPPPSGIVAATAGDLTIDFGYFSGAIYSKISNTQWIMVFGEGETQRLVWNTIIANTWVLDANNGDFRATNPSSDSTIIPTSGWTYTISSGPAITITAA